MNSHFRYFKFNVCPVKEDEKVDETTWVNGLVFDIL